MGRVKIGRIRFRRIAYIGRIKFRRKGEISAS
jgi:hypothetical protein